LIAEAGDLVDMVALHMMHQRPDSDDSILHGRGYRKDYGKTWEALGEMYKKVEDKLVEARSVVSATGSKARLAVTEGHLSIQPHNKSELLREWISGLYHARVMTLFERHSDIVDICTLADFAGTTWTVNAVMLGSPREQPYLLPVGHIMRLFKKVSGTHGLNIASSDPALEVSASRTGNKIFVHLVNTDLENSHSVELDLGDAKPVAIVSHSIAQELDAGIDTTALDVFAVTERPHTSLAGLSVPKASVMALEITVA